MGKGGGGGPTQTSSTVQNTNIPEYAKGYVENMLGATQEQLFQGTRTPTVTDPTTGEVTGGEFQISGFKPYQAYGGTYDQNKTLPDGTPNPNYGKQLSYDPSKAIAGFQDMQLAAQQGIAGMRVPDQYNQAINYANDATRGAFSTAQPALGYGAQGAAAGQQAANYGQMGYQSGALGQQIGTQAAAAAAKLAAEQAQRANKFGDAGFASGQKGQELGIAGGQLGISGGAKYGDIGAGYGGQAAGLADPALAYGAQGAEYGGTGAGYGAQAAELANTALGYGQGAADIGQMALRAQGMGANVARQSQDIARQQTMAGQQYAQMATDPRVTQALMNPYTQNVLDVQNKELQRQSDIAGTQRGAQAARAGAFGGSRQAIENAEANRALAVMKNANQAQALNQAYQQAQAQQQFGANLNLQGLAGAQQGLGTALQGGQLGLSGLGTALQGQQGALAGVGQAGAMYGLGMQGAQTGMQGTQAGLQGISAANQAYQTGIQGAGLGLQGVNTQLSGVDRQLAGTGQGMQGAQVGLAGVNAAVGAGQLGLQGAQTGMQGTAQGMQGAQTGIQGQQAAMQGAGMGLQGVQGAQAAYGLGNQTAANMANIAGQQLQSQQGIYGMQNTAGAQQQALEQAKINQAMLDYANAQQYPLMQLGTMSNMLRGLPMQASTTNQYAASPNPLSQAIGTIGAGTSIYNAYNPTGKAAGGEIKGYAKGGIMSYDMGGEVESQLESMDEKGLAEQAKTSASPTIRKMAQRLLRERQMSNKAQGADAANVQYQAAQPQMPSYAPGGIVAFQQGAGGNGAMSAIEEGGDEEARVGMQERLAMPPSTTPPPGGIMGATTQPTTPTPYAPQAGRAMQQAADIPAFMKAEYADAEKRAAAPLSSFLAERKAAMEEAGVADTSEGQQKLRAEMMAEKANLGEEKERQKHLRLAEFFAAWGSTPGPVLVAGLNAMQKAVPNIMADEKEQKKARREIDKSIADLDNATRLEKRGEIDAAMQLKLKAAEDMKALNMKFIDYQSRRESDQSSAAASKYSADMQFRSEQLRSQTSALDRAARRDTDKDNKIFGQWQAAAKTEADILGRIQREENDKQHMADLAAVKLGMQTGMNEDTNKFDRTKVPPAVLTAMEEAEKRIKDREKNWKNRIEQAGRNTDLAYSRVAIKPEDATRDYTRSTGGAQAGASTRPALTDPSLQR